MAVCSGILDSVSRLSMDTLSDWLEAFLQVHGTSRRADHLAVCAFQTNLWISTMYLSHACLKAGATIACQKDLVDICAINIHMIS